MQRAWQEWSGRMERGSSCLAVPSREVQRLCEKIKTLEAWEGLNTRHAGSNLEGLGLASPGWAPGSSPHLRQMRASAGPGLPGCREAE